MELGNKGKETSLVDGPWFLKSCDDVGLLIVIIQLGKMKKWDGVMQVQNAFFGTKLFMHKGKESILNDDLQEIEEFRKRLILLPEKEQSSNTASKISIASKFSAHEEFVTKNRFRNIDELIELPKGEVFVIVATAVLIQEEEGWWYLGCRKCHTKVSRNDEQVVPGSAESSASTKGNNCYFCKLCNVLCSSVITRFCIQCRVQDDTGTASLVLFEKDVKSILDGNSAYQLLATQEKNGKLDKFPSDFNKILERKYAFKISMDEWQSKKLLPSWTVQKMCDDPDIIKSLIHETTQSKGQTTDSALKDTNVSQLDLGSVMDDNGTPSDVLKSITSTPNENSSTNKRNGDGVLGDQGSNT